MGMAADPCESPSVQLIVASIAVSSTSHGPIRIVMLAPSSWTHANLPTRLPVLIARGVQVDRPLASAQVCCLAWRQRGTSGDGTRKGGPIGTTTAAFCPAIAGP